MRHAGIGTGNAIEDVIDGGTGLLTHHLFMQHPMTRQTRFGRYSLGP